MSGQQGKKNVIEIVFVLNKENTFGLQNDVSVIEEGIRLQAQICGIPMPNIRKMDPREPPVACDICLHFEVPYAVWFSWARSHCMIVNPEWWKLDWNGYKESFNQWIFKTESAKGHFINAGLCDEAKSSVMPWRSNGLVQRQPVKVKKMPHGKEEEVAVEYNESSVGWVWFLGGSLNKRAAALEILPLWRDDFSELTVYTTSPLEIDAVLAKNVHIKVKDLTKEEHSSLCEYYPGHICISKSEGFGYTAAEAEKVGAFCILNTLDTYKEYYDGMSGVFWLNTPLVEKDYASFADFSNKDEIVEGLVSANKLYNSVDLKDVRMSRKQDSIGRSRKWDKSFHEWFLKSTGSLNSLPKLPKFLPPVLNTMDCPPISIVTLLHGRPKFLELAFHNLMLSDYPRNKMEWVIIDDSPAEESGSDKIVAFEEKFFPGKVRYIPLPKKISIGRKRNIGVKRSANEIILMMDDDDHYPQTSFRRRVAWLTNGGKPCAVCTSIALYDLQKGISAVNVPPFNLGLSARASEATLTFKKDFWLQRAFLEVDMAEGEEFLKGRESSIIEMPPQQIIVAFTHGKNTSSRRIPGSDGTNGCFWGFPKEFLYFVHGLAGVDIEES